MKNSATIEDLLAALTEGMPAQDLLSAGIISSLSNAIAQRRISMGLSQTELAAKVGKTQGTISKWENGDMNFTVETLADIAVKLDMNLTIKMEAPAPVRKSGNYRFTTGGVDSKVINFGSVRSNLGNTGFRELKEM